ncbi:MAG TPA: hypothetical protein VEQ11_15745 [Chloroflexota bacterium]|nr:hypothetical protein [Chloroflexota bacterium]
MLGERGTAFAEPARLDVLTGPGSRSLMVDPSTLVRTRIELVDTQA